ncbi:hypothetical protein EVAR_28251_1 [Eumeta japonica]|uniref:Uncharacterized protein n=1 Tax=Eumeta variegata TaxID=151549 RepID=A0A4C1V753_EUMVA|nr:hypothetical protein EVAR_28251_1 [Eumeta japonica]
MCARKYAQFTLMFARKPKTRPSSTIALIMAYYTKLCPLHDGVTARSSFDIRRCSGCAHSFNHTPPSADDTMMICEVMNSKASKTLFVFGFKG